MLYNVIYTILIHLSYLNKAGKNKTEVLYLGGMKSNLKIYNVKFVKVPISHTSLSEIERLGRRKHTHTHTICTVQVGLI